MKIIRPTYPLEISIGILFLVFATALFLSAQIFASGGHPLQETNNVYVGMFLVSTAVVIMCLVLWEEFLFPVKVKPAGNGVVFRNHRTKLKKQLLIYCAIPVIFAFVYIEYNVNLTRFIIWAAICIVGPVAGKLISGINNYNDFLKLTSDAIEYRNNKKVGTFQLKELQSITLVRDERTVLHKLQLLLADGTEVLIDLDEMELQDFLTSIDKFITARYKTLVKELVRN